jgi:hypothetical protein
VQDGLRRLAASGHLRLVSFDGRTAVFADAGPLDPAPSRLRSAPRPQAAPGAGQDVTPAASPSQPTPAAETTAPEGIQATEAIVVTGNTSGRRTQFNSSSNVTLASAAELQRKAPRSTAETLELVPGIFVEATAGPASNNYSVRGLRGGGQTFITLEQDGLPILYGGGGADFYFQQDLSVDRMEAVEGGTSGVLAPMARAPRSTSSRASSISTSWAAWRGSVARPIPTFAPMPISPVRWPTAWPIA